MEDYLANFFARRGATGFARYGDGNTVGAEGARQFLNLRAFAAAVEAFEGDEFSTRGHFGMIAGRIVDGMADRSRQ